MVFETHHWSKDKEVPWIGCKSMIFLMKRFEVLSRDERDVCV